MLEKQTKKGKVHLINLIGRRNDSTPNFALLIGAGASVSSGVKPTGHMMAEWRMQLYKQSKSKEPFPKWLGKQDWCGDEEEYSILFEQIYDQRSQRRIYIEECVKNARPSWGYVYLANIIAHNYFNVAFTPNFDDLLNEACFLYADIRPIVCAHDSAVAGIRVTSARPKIIKLHGDFLYDSIKNTITETESLEKNMRDKFIQFSREYGLVVIGYGGNDRSIMDILDMMLRSEDSLPYGLYWCMRKGGAVSRKLDRLMRREKAYWVEIGGFDEFMAELHDGLGLRLPDTVSDPYKAVTERLNSFVLPMKGIKHRIIKKAITKLNKEIKRFEQIISGRATTEETERLLPFGWRGDIEFDGHNYDEALSYYEKALNQNPNDLRIMGMIGASYNYLEQHEAALRMSEQMIKLTPRDYRGYYLKGHSLSYLNKAKDSIKSYSKALKLVTDAEKQASILTGRSNAYLMVGDWKKAFSDAEKGCSMDPDLNSCLINKALAMKKLGKKREAERILQDALSRFDSFHRACAFAMFGQKKRMLKELKEAIEEDDGNRVDAKLDPDFADYRENPDFQKLVSKEGK